MTKTKKRALTPGFQRGFNLLELIVVIAIASIVLLGAINMFESVVKTTRAKSASFNLYTSLSFARAEAIKRSMNVKIAQNTGGWSAGWKVTYVDPDDSTTKEIQSQDAFSDVVISAGTCPSLSTAVTEISFTSTGRMSATSLPCFEIDISSTATDYRRCTRVDLGGSPRTTKGSCS